MSITGRVCLYTFIVLLGLIYSDSNFLLAQDVPELPPSSEAGVLEKRQREETQEDLLFTPPPTQVQVDKEEEKPPASAEAVTFQVEKIILQTSSLEPELARQIEPELEGLRPLLQTHEGKTMTLAALKKFTDFIEQQLRAKGFLVGVYIPAQRMEGGIVRLEVLFSKMGNLYVVGNRYFKTKRIESLWRIPQGSIVHFKQLQKSLYDINDNPDLSARVLLSKSELPQSVDITLKVKDKFPVHLGTTFDNHGVRLTGRERSGINLRHNNFLGFNDTLLVGTVFGGDFGALYVNHVLPIGPWGTRLLYGYSHSQVNPKKEFKAFGVNGISDIYTIRLQQKLFRTLNHGGTALIGFDFKEKKTRILSVTSIWERLRVLSLEGRFYARDKSGLWGLSQGVYVGLPFRGDSFPLTSRGADTQFTKYEFGLTRKQRLFWGLRAQFELEGQFTENRLPSQEQHFLGGASTIRGYPESDYGADQSILTRSELWLPVPLLPSAWKDQIHMIGFLDHGYGRVVQPQSERTSRNMAGIGGGFQVQYRDFVSARLEWGKPILDPALTQSGKSQFHFRVSIES